MEIIRGTTPTIEYTFSDITVDDIEEAYLTIIQGDVHVIRDISSATIGEESISWTLTQAETLQFKTFAQATIYLDWIAKDGTRGAGRTVTTGIAPTGKDEVI